MRTKLILTTAALGVSSLGALAQVYSVNAVGYINVTVPAGTLAIVANQLNAGAGNTVAEVIPSTAEETLLYTFDQATGFNGNSYTFGAWDRPAETLPPGKAFFVRAPAGATALTLTFVGEVPQGSLATPLLSGLNFVASQVPQAGALTAALGYTPAEGDIVFQWDGATQNYKAANGFNFGAWDSGDPVIAVGEGFFLQKGAAGSWTRTFSVNP